MPDFINAVLFICWSNIVPNLVSSVVNVLLLFLVLMEIETIQVSEIDSFNEEL